jgi:hypothetical protein
LGDGSSIPFFSENGLTYLYFTILKIPKKKNGIEDPSPNPEKFSKKKMGIFCGGPLIPEIFQKQHIKS